jgi:hypothetical protein
LEEVKPEKFVIKVPKVLWFRPDALAFCMARSRGIFFLGASVIYGVFVFNYDYSHFPTSAFDIAFTVFFAVSCAIFFLLSFLAALPSIFIRKDCSECQFGFHIIDHERNHLLLNSSDEFTVEEETLKQTKDRLIPLLLSNLKLCKDCPFNGRRMYCKTTLEYLSTHQS